MLVDARYGLSQHRRAGAAESAIYVVDGDRAQAMMRDFSYFIRSSAIGAATAIAIALWLGISGCGLMHKDSDSDSNGSETVPISPEAAGVANTLSHQPGYDKDEDRNLKCEQLGRNPP